MSEHRMLTPEEFSESRKIALKEIRDDADVKAQESLRRYIR